MLRAPPRSNRSLGGPMERVLRMIKVSRLDGKEFVLNALLIETVESVPDTVVTLTNGRKYVVQRVGRRSVGTGVRVSPLDLGADPGLRDDRKRRE